MHIDPIGSTPDGPGISAVLADAENADDLGTSIRFVSNKASLSSVAIIIVEHRRGLAEVAPARVRMDLFRSTTVGQKRSRDQKFCSCHGRLGTPLNVADRSLSTECNDPHPVSWHRPCDERVLQNRGKARIFMRFDEYSCAGRHPAVQRLFGMPSPPTVSFASSILNRQRSGRRDSQTFLARRDRFGNHVCAARDLRLFCDSRMLVTPKGILTRLEPNLTG